MASDKYDLPEPVGAMPEPKKARGKYDLPDPIKPAGTPAPTLGQGEAAGRGLLHGATLGLEGYLAAAGLAEAGGLTGEYYGTPDEILKEQRRLAAERILEARQQYPKTTGVSEFAGGMLAPVPIPRGASLLGRMGIGAGTGGVIGGVSSFGGAENPTPGEFALSAGAGALAGGALPVVTGAAGLVGRAVAERLGLTRLPWFRDAGHEAATGVNTAREQAALVEQEARARAAAQGYPYERQTLTPPELGPGRPGMAIDVLGTPGQELGRSAANRSPVARATLEGPLYQRRATQLERAEAPLTPTLNYPLAGQEVEALARPSAQVTQAYRVARELGDGRIDMSPPALQTLVQMPVVQVAFRRAQGDLENAHLLENYQRAQQGLPPRNPPSLNDLATWDMVKRNLDAMYNQAIGKNPNRARIIADTASTLRQAMDAQVPEYAQARALSRAEILARNAFQEGRDFLTKGDLHETQQALAALQTTSPQAIDAFQQGFTHAMLERMRAKATAGNLYAQVKETPDQTARVTIALGAGRAAQQSQQRADEEIMQRALQAVTGNSTTARQLSQIGLAAGGGALGYAAGLTADDLFGIGHTMHAAGLGVAIPLITRALTRQPGLNVDIQVANRIARMLVSRDPDQLAILAQRANTLPPLRQALDSLNGVLQPALARGVAGTAARTAVPEPGAPPP